MTNNKQQTAMKKLLLATLLIGMIAGCTEPLLNKEIDRLRSRANCDCCHKGNCKNLIHKKDEQQ